MVCGEDFSIITVTHLDRHDFTLKQYRKLFPNAPIASDDFAKKAGDFHRGRKRSAETRLNISIGMKNSKKAQQRGSKISKKLRGRPLSPEHRKKLSIAKKGKPWTEKQRIAITRGLRASEKLKHPWNEGLTKETEPRLRRMSEKLKGRKNPHTPEWNRKISEGTKASWQRPEVREAHINGLIGSRHYIHRPTPLQVRVMEALDLWGINYSCERPIKTENSLRYADILIAGTNLIIECDSEFWHKNRKEEDRKRDRELLKAGYRILHLSEKTINRKDLESFLLGQIIRKDYTVRYV